MAQSIGNIIEALILSIICIVSVLGNLTVFVIFTRRHAFRTVTNGFLLNLAFADLLVSVLNMPITVVTIVKQRWIFGKNACLLLGFTTLLSFVSSVMWLAMIAINRYYYVVKWKTYSVTFAPRRSVVFGAIVWLISLLLSLPPIFGWAEFRYIPGKSFCFVYWPSDVYYMYFMLTVCFFGPLTVMSISYFNIFKYTREARQRLNQHRDVTNEEKTAQENGRIRRGFKVTPEEVKITNTILVVVACFMFCWAPFAMTTFTDVYYNRPIPRIIDISTLLLGYANSMCNPVIYGIRNQSFRRELSRLFRRCYAPSRTVPAVKVVLADRSQCPVNIDQSLEAAEASKLYFKSSSDEATAISTCNFEG